MAKTQTPKGNTGYQETPNSSFSKTNCRGRCSHHEIQRPCVLMETLDDIKKAHTGPRCRGRAPGPRPLPALQAPYLGREA